ncbi:MAG: hypothetical protein CVT64_09455 [Actinobacteria bacterium HGW-Actinobacteria-4]|nr:MAG: hypothetical protein CVT64_09455 [Actinobacteria bacterium HGW-Actinobacteria-4]
MTFESATANQAVIVGDKSTPDSVVIPVPGAIGVVTLERWRKKPYVALDGRRLGNASGAKIPLGNGSKARVKIKALIAGSPRVYVDGREVFTTPQPSIGLIILAVTPLLSLLILQGAIGFALAFGGLAGAQAIVRKDTMSTVARVLSVIGIAVATIAIAFAILVAVLNVQ